jgi:hypothetical protein
MSAPTASKRNCRSWHLKFAYGETSRPARATAQTLLVCLCLALAMTTATGAAAKPPPPGPGLAAAIKHRLQAAGYPVYPPAAPSSFRPAPQASFYTIADYASSHAYELFVYVFATRSDASTAYDRYAAQLARIGTAGANKLLLAGRVVFLGATGPLNQSLGPAPTLPVKHFNALVAFAEGHSEAGKDRAGPSSSRANSRLPRATQTFTEYTRARE